MQSNLSKFQGRRAISRCARKEKSRGGGLGPNTDHRLGMTPLGICAP